jgi:hypothetical protein
MESATKVQKKVNYKDMVFSVLKKTNDPALDQMMGKIFIAAESKAMKLELEEAL